MCCKVRLGCTSGKSNNSTHRHGSLETRPLPLKKHRPSIKDHFLSSSQSKIIASALG